MEVWGQWNFSISYNLLMVKISVLIPCFNTANTVPETLNTLLAQTFTDFEIVAVDDGSTDDTVPILERYRQQDERMRIIRQEHSGIIDALNNGLSNCRAPLVARMDADDLAHPERLELQYQLMQQHPEITVGGCLVDGFPKDQVREGFRIYLEWLNRLVTHDEIAREIFIESPLPHPSVIFRKDAVLQVGGYQEHGWAEDYDLWLRLFLSGARFLKVPRVLVSWREHEIRLTRTDSRYSLENFIRAKAHYLAAGPLVGRDAVILWGAGMNGRRLSKHLQRADVPLVAYVDVDPKKIGRTQRGLPIIAADELMPLWAQYRNPVVLAAVAARGARALIRTQLIEFGLVEGVDWWSVA